MPMEGKSASKYERKKLLCCFFEALTCPLECRKPFCRVFSAIQGFKPPLCLCAVGNSLDLVLLITPFEDLPLNAKANRKMNQRKWVQA